MTIRKLATAAFLLAFLCGISQSHSAEFDSDMLVGSWQFVVTWPDKKNYITMTFETPNASGRGAYSGAQDLEPQGTRSVGKGSYQLEPPKLMGDLAVVTTSTATGDQLFHIRRISETHLSLGYEVPPNGFQTFELDRVR